MRPKARPLELTIEAYISKVRFSEKIISKVHTLQLFCEKIATEA